MIESLLPKTILKKAVKSSKEFGWKQADFYEVIEAATLKQLAIIGGQVQYIFPDATCELYWLSYDSTARKKNEIWSDFVLRSKNEVMEKFENVIMKDINNEAIKSFEEIKTKVESGIDISKHKIFILYFEAENSDKTSSR
jgi:hypothetical protein